MNNLETLDRQYFWMERPKAVIQELLRHYDKVEDVTYVNDDCPSIMINDKYQVYLPNSIHLDEYKTNMYGVIRDLHMQEGNTAHFKYGNTLDNVVDIIDEMIHEDEPISRKEVAHRMRMVMDDLRVIKRQLTPIQLSMKTNEADELLVHFNNIEIACDLESKESLTWELYSK